MKVNYWNQKGKEEENLQWNAEAPKP